jgi:hypothetical protein
LNFIGINLGGSYHLWRLVGKVLQSSLLNESNGAPKAIHAYLIFPIGCSKFESLSRLNMATSSKIGDLGIETHLCLLSVGGMLPPRGDLNGKCTCRFGCTLLPNTIVGGGDCNLVAICLTTTEGPTLDMIWAAWTLFAFLVTSSSVASLLLV